VQQVFSDILANALQVEALAHGHSYPEGGAQAWGKVGAAYLGFALCHLTPPTLRSIQYNTRELFGPVILECKWYDSLKQQCLGGQQSIHALLPSGSGSLMESEITVDLLLEMFDFCREG